MNDFGETRIRFPIGIKLITIIGLLVLLSLGTITILVSYFVGKDVRITAETNTFTVNSRSAAAAENELQVIRANVSLLLDLLNAASSSPALSRQASSFFFERNQNVAAILVTSGLRTYQEGSAAGDVELTNFRFFSANEVDSSAVGSFMRNEQDAVARACGGEIIIQNASPSFGIPVLAFLYPWRENGREQATVIFFSAETLTDTFSAGSVNVSFMVNDSGDLLVYPDFELVRSGANFSAHPLVARMRTSQSGNRQILYKDNGTSWFGAYQKLGTANAGVLTIAEADTVYESVRTTTYRNVCITAAVLCIAILCIWMYSKTISSPLKSLTAASEDIERGSFDIRLKPETDDELGVLTQSFVRMGKGLAERERLKETFGKFINRDIADKAARGELTLGGETKTVTVFFSDIRSFTSISEKLQPFEVVEFLNDYMTRMVSCVNSTNGVVDKFIGDAVMAVWGAPVSAGSPAEDALNCVRAALMMRFALQEFNKGRGGEKKPIIKIGCGINTGPVIAGQIGSSERMEYTVIGDAVNFASRTESLNKPFGTDILITENTWQLIKEHVTAEEMPSVTVKGKEKPVRIYAVVNMPEADDIPGAGPTGPSSLNQVREALGIPIPDLAKVHPDEDEKKYTINE